MATIRKTITFTDQQDRWIKAQVEAGEFTNDSEYIRHLVRRDQLRNSKYVALKTALQRGIESGMSNKNIADIMKDVEIELKANGRL